VDVRHGKASRSRYRHVHAGTDRDGEQSCMLPVTLFFSCRANLMIASRTGFSATSCGCTIIWRTKVLSLDIHPEAACADRFDVCRDRWQPARHARLLAARGACCPLATQPKCFALTLLLYAQIPGNLDAALRHPISGDYLFFKGRQVCHERT
jgi:hypothetical protein